MTTQFGFDFFTAASLLLGIPESVGLLIFGAGLAATGAILRAILKRRDKESKNDNSANEA